MRTRILRLKTVIGGEFLGGHLYDLRVAILDDLQAEAQILQHGVSVSLAAWREP